MKARLIKIFTIGLFLLISTVAIAGYFASTSSGELTTDQAVVTGAGQLSGVIILTNGASDATVILYNNTTITGATAAQKVFEMKVTSTDNYGGRNWAYPVKFTTGLALDITGTGASCIIETTSP